MKTIFTLLLLPIFLYTGIMAQDVSVQVNDPPIPVISGPDWANDIVVSSNEPFGKLSGIKKTSNNTIYLAVPDTLTVANRSLNIYASSNNGNNWAVVSGITPGGMIVSKTKMVRSGLDSIYCFFQIGATVYVWNIINNNFHPFALGDPIRDFDAVASSTGAIYLFTDENVDNDIRRYGSTNGGISWPSTGFVASTGAHCRVYMSGTGDTLILNYFSPVLTDTLTSIIRGVRYRETTPGTLSTAGSFTNWVSDVAPKPEFQSVFHSGRVWFFWVQGSTGNINLRAMVSTNSGTTFNAPILVGGNPNTDEYWFEARHYESGVDIAYYSDSLQVGTPNNGTDKMLYRWASTAAPETFSIPVQISEHPPGWSARGYMPAVVELGNADLGVAWVGLDGANKRVYWDRYSAVSAIKNIQNEVVSEYSLSQNYPNPFNPVTTIEFSIPKDEFVTMKIFDIQGREAAIIISKDMKRGAYEVTFDASQLSSGLYFYKLETSSFTDTKKMILIK